MSENNKEQDFVDRVGTHRNRRKLTIISQSPNEMIVDIERADSATIDGSIISADTLNDFQDEIDTANSYASSALSTANSANTTAQTASTTANSANQTATSADTKATTALSNSQTAITTANEAKAKALEVESKLADRGAIIKINGASKTEINFTSDPQTQISNEVTARTNADNNLQNQITNEITTRQNIDSSLQAQINTKLNTADLLNSVYPIGSIYMSVNTTSSDTLFGGTWEMLKDKFLLGAGDSYSIGTTDGETQHTLTTAEMPNHIHNNSITVTATQASHNHTALTGTCNSNNSLYSLNTVSLGYKTVSGFGGMEPGDKSTTYVKESGCDKIKSLLSKETPAITVDANITNANAGNGQAHNNMPPYLVVNMWKRIS